MSTIRAHTLDIALLLLLLVAMTVVLGAVRAARALHALFHFAFTVGRDGVPLSSSNHCFGHANAPPRSPTDRYTNPIPHILATSNPYTPTGDAYPTTHPAPGIFSNSPAAGGTGCPPATQRPLHPPPQ